MPVLVSIGIQRRARVTLRYICEHITKSWFLAFGAIWGRGDERDGSICARHGGPGCYKRARRGYGLVYRPAAIQESAPLAGSEVSAGTATSGSKDASVAATRIDQNVLSRWIAEVAIALRQIVAGSCGSLCACDGTDGAAGDSAGNRAAGPSGEKATQEPAHDRAADRSRGGIRRWGRRWRRIIGSERGRRIISGNGWSIRPAVIVDRLYVRHISRRSIELLRIEIPDAANVPPPAVASVIGLMTPASTLPGYATVIGTSAKIALRQTASRILLRPSDGSGARSRAARLDRWFALHAPLLIVLFLCLRGQRKDGCDGYQRQDDPRAPEGAHVQISP